ncbi:MAG TPA: tetraacyldisaccharide 4'-kinase [Pirellulales bacterium]|nr:tetraacyldisaccharide 4'-kinase [Pirellulales bacterium]
MLNAVDFRELVSGRRRGPMASLLRGLLRWAESLYTWIVVGRNKAFESGRKASQKIGIPVVSVGNLTLGGTGKTPLVEWIARWFLNRGIKIALVSRGYKSSNGAPNDEAQELAQKLPGVVHLQNPDRVAAARLAVREFQSELIILDDAFQHRRIARDLDIVLLDALEPFGFGHVFPRGMLREPIAGMSRANLAVLTRADMVNEVERARIRGIVERYAPQIAWVECRHAPRSLLAADGQEESLGALRGRQVAAFCGLGNPAGFRHTLAECGCNVVAWREFPDHFIYNNNTVDELARWTALHGADVAVCTHKDLVKLPVNKLGDRPLRAVLVGLEFLRGQDALEAKLKTLLPLVSSPK